MPPPPPATVATPTISASASNGAQNGAMIVSLATTTAGASIYYTTDGTTPTAASTQYIAPFLLMSNVTLNAIATLSGDTNSSVGSQSITANVPSGMVAWSDDFTNTGATNAQPNPSTWTYDVGYQCCGNDEQETYCAWGSSAGSCNPATPNAYIAPGGGLNIVAMQPSAGTYTSARLKTQGLFSFQYGRIEAQLQIPESQGMWPAFWLLGNNITTINWPSCGEADVMEHIDGNNTPFGGPGSGAAPGYDWTQASIHGTGLNGGTPTDIQGFSATTLHTYGMIWSKGQIQYYVDNPANVYETFTTTNPGTGTWPFDQGPMFIILNLAVGGTWPGDVNSNTVFPSTYLVNYVKIYAN
ncbi:MAG: family 16 glycosylhydrolase [Terracidiphilus sp.]|jgi:beta-glucanase (GH16 family)